jgi:hypothetical protein
MLVRLVVEVSSSLRDRFRRAVNKKGTTMNFILTNFMEDYIKSNSD